MPSPILKGGAIAGAAMGDPNASIPTPQPVHYRPMFGALGRARTASPVVVHSKAAIAAGMERPIGRARTASSVVFTSKAAIASGLKRKLGIEKELYAVKNTRGGISKKSMINN